jgi:hypothetical protein
MGGIMMLNIEILDVCAGYLGGSGIPSKLAHVIYLVVRTIQVVVPILLIIWGMLDLGKAVMAQKEDDIKKGQQTFIKRVVAAILVFFVVAITKLIIGLFAPDGGTANKGSLLGCMNSILNCSDESKCGDEYKEPDL